MEPDKNQLFVMNAAPDQWASYAGEIKSTMDLLWNNEGDAIILSYSDLGTSQKKSSISRTWLLLAGFAMENLIKGIVIAEHPEYISNGKLSRKVSTHKLTNLSEMIESISFEDDEKKLLRILETCIPSWGRYPIPKSGDEIRNEIPATLDLKTIFDYLFRKLDLHLYNMIRLGWKGPHNCGSTGLIRSDLEKMPDGFEKMDFDEMFKRRDSRTKNNE